MVQHVMRWDGRIDNREKDNLNLYKKIEKIKGKNTMRNTGILLDWNGKMTSDIGKRVKRCQEYIQELFETKGQNYYGK